MEQNEEEQKEVEVKEVEKLGRLQFKLDYDFNNTNVRRLPFCNWKTIINVNPLTFIPKAGRDCDPGRGSASL